MVDITDRTSEAVRESGLKSGIVTVFVPGSTAGITTIEYEPGLLKDFPAAIERLVPSRIDYEHNRTSYGEDNGHSHVRASFLGPSLTVPFAEKKLLLGTWQQVVLVDFDTRPRNRSLIFQVMGE